MSSLYEFSQISSIFLYRLLCIVKNMSIVWPKQTAEDWPVGGWNVRNIVQEWKLGFLALPFTVVVGVVDIVDQLSSPAKGQV